jgi:hypothetical protein
MENGIVIFVVSVKNDYKFIYFIDAQYHMEICVEYVYLIKTREVGCFHEQVYKVGRTSQCNLQRLIQYPKGSILLLQMNCVNSIKVENDVKKLFNEKYVLKKAYGAEYFEGDYVSMIHDIYTIAKDSLPMSTP